MDKILKQLLFEKEEGFKGGLYHWTQINLAYNSNRIEGSRLTEEQTRYMFETKTVLPVDASTATPINDIIEMQNHFRLFNRMLETAGQPLSEELIKEYHRILKEGTLDAEKAWFAVGEYKKLPNEVGLTKTAAPAQVPKMMNQLIQEYNNNADTIDLKTIVTFHHLFESIHPFQDGNGRIGRMIMFKECLRNGETPFIIEDVKKAFYYRGLQEYRSEPGYLLETCRDAQDNFLKAVNRFLPPEQKSVTHKI